MFLATVNDVHMTALDKFLAVVLIALGVLLVGILDSLETGLADVRRRLNPLDHNAAIRGRDIMNLHKAILWGAPWLLYGLSLSSLELGAPFFWGVLVEAGSGKEFFDELADNLEARSPATQTSPILASPLCFKSAFFNGSLSIFRKQSPPLALG